jgi:subtilisin family serine protease
MSAIVQGRIEQYYDDELVIAVAHRREIYAALSSVGIAWAEADTIPELGLALVTLANLGPSSAALRRNKADLAARAARRRSLAGADDVPDLDLVIDFLRDEFGRDYGGWTPTIGKNRHVDNISGFPHISGGAAEPPQAAAGPPRFEPPTAPAGRGVRVGVLDTRLIAHPALTGRYRVQRDGLLPDAPETEELAGHATFVAGLIAARAPGALLDVRHVLSDDRAVSTSWQVAKKMMEFLDSGVSILNTSLGCFTDDGQPPLVLQVAAARLSPRMLLVSAAGNHGDETGHNADLDDAKWNEFGYEEVLTPGPVMDHHPEPGPKAPTWPAALDGVVAVGADGPAAGERARFSPRAPWVDLMAPGVKVTSTYLFGQVSVRRHRHESDGSVAVRRWHRQFNGYAQWSGTSFAAGTVSGHIAARTRPGQLGAQEVAEQLLHLPDGQDDAGVRPYRIGKR